MQNVEEPSWYRTPAVLNKPLERIADAADVPQIFPHSLRRTWENLMRQAGVDQLVRRAVAGWRTEKAQEIYASVDRGERDAAAAAMVGFVRGEG
jgi:integrase